MVVTYYWHGCHGFHFCSYDGQSVIGHLSDLESKIELRLIVDVEKMRAGSPRFVCGNKEDKDHVDRRSLL